MTPAVSPHITTIATKLVHEILPGRCPKWRIEQLMHEATTAVGMTGDKVLIRQLLEAARTSRGKIEYEIEAVEDVLIRFYREITCS
jgi:hypothetical protein